MITNGWHVSTFSGGTGCIEVQYRTSSFCGEGSCVEVAYTTSSFCSGGDCVEVGTMPGRVLVRDTKDRSRPPAVFPAAEWAAFTAAVKAGTLTPC